MRVHSCMCARARARVCVCGGGGGGGGGGGRNVREECCTLGNGDWTNSAANLNQVTFPDVLRPCLDLALARAVERFEAEGADALGGQPTESADGVYLGWKSEPTSRLHL